MSTKIERCATNCISIKVRFCIRMHCIGLTIQSFATMLCLHPKCYEILAIYHTRIGESISKEISCTIIRRSKGYSSANCNGPFKIKFRIVNTFSIFRIGSVSENSCPWTTTIHLRRSSSEGSGR